MLIFTPAERRAILITIVVILAACGYQMINAYRPNPFQGDYREQDSLFARLSDQPVGYGDEQAYMLSFRPLTDQKIKTADIQRINLNTATSVELQKLPRVGPAMAARILEYRQKNGKFNTTSELMKVKGIGKKTFEKIKPYLAEIR